MTLENIRMRALALRSSIHNEHQLSAIELAGMCAKKTNELIDVINDFTLLVQTTIEGQLVVEYNEETESMDIKIKEVNENE